jgi:hypothetical protein
MQARCHKLVSDDPLSKLRQKSSKASCKPRLRKTVKIKPLVPLVPLMPIHGFVVKGTPPQRFRTFRKVEKPVSPSFSCSDEEEIGHFDTKDRMSTMQLDLNQGLAFTIPKGGIRELFRSLRSSSFYSSWCQVSNCTLPGDVIQRMADEHVLVLWTQSPLMLVRRLSDDRCMFMLVGTGVEAGHSHSSWINDAFTWAGSVKCRCPGLASHILEHLDVNLSKLQHYQPLAHGLIGSRKDRDGLLSDTHCRLSKQIVKLADQGGLDHELIFFSADELSILD